MKKFIYIVFIAIIAILNFTLVKSKTGEVSLKSITELAQANADENPTPGTKTWRATYSISYEFSTAELRYCTYNYGSFWCDKRWTVVNYWRNTSGSEDEFEWDGEVWHWTGHSREFSNTVLLNTDNPGCPLGHYN